MSDPFSVTTSVRCTGPGGYEAEIDPSWNLNPLPQGGVVTAIALRAMADLLGDPSQALRTLHTAFVAQVGDGPVGIQVELLRRGRSMSHLRADVTNPGANRGHTTTAIFGARRAGFDFTDPAPPAAVAAPADCPSFRDPPPAGARSFDPMPFWMQRVEGRAAIGHAPWDDYVPERAERAAWYRFDETPFLADGSVDPTALVVLADTMPGAVGEMVGPGPRSWFAPSIDLTVHLLDTCRSPWVLAHNRARYAGDGYASADMALWDYGENGTGAPRLVAYGTQLFLFSFID